eukprot:7362823-Prymnesium_polylepis.1
MALIAVRCERPGRLACTSQVVRRRLKSAQPLIVLCARSMAQAEAVGHAGTWRLGHLSFLRAPCELGDFGAFSLRHIVSLDCSGATYLDDLAPLRSLVALETLTLCDCTSLNDIGPLGASKQLTALDCTCCTGIIHVEALASCRWLRTLNLSYCRCGTRGIRAYTSRQMTLVLCLRGLGCRQEPRRCWPAGALRG